MRECAVRVSHTVWQSCWRSAGTLSSGMKYVLGRNMSRDKICCGIKCPPSYTLVSLNEVFSSSPSPTQWAFDFNFYLFYHSSISIWILGSLPFSGILSFSIFTAYLGDLQNNCAQIFVFELYLCLFQNQQFCLCSKRTTCGCSPEVHMLFQPLPEVLIGAPATLHALLPT